MHRERKTLPQTGEGGLALRIVAAPCGEGEVLLASTAPGGLVMVLPPGRTVPASHGDGYSHRGWRLATWSQTDPYSFDSRTPPDAIYKLPVETLILELDRLRAADASSSSGDIVGRWIAQEHRKYVNDDAATLRALTERSRGRGTSAEAVLLVSELLHTLNVARVLWGQGWLDALDPVAKTIVYPSRRPISGRRRRIPGGGRNVSRLWEPSMRARNAELLLSSGNPPGRF